MKETILREILAYWEEVFSVHKRPKLAQAFAGLSAKYRNPVEKKSGSFFESEEEKIAYLFTRFPSTFYAVCDVWEKILSLDPSFCIDSLLDVGAGPGTGMWAARAVFPGPFSVTIWEKDAYFWECGQKLLSLFPMDVSVQITDLEKGIIPHFHDLVVLSYSLGELSAQAQKEVISSLWQHTHKALCIIEPGTPAGYARVMRMRELLVQEGGYVWAPCPHSACCPVPRGDWCHFSVRVPRSSVHRMLKEGSLGYEDEKFSYIVIGKQARSCVAGRIVRHPQIHTGHVDMTVCRKEGIRTEIYTKKHKEEYKRNKKLSWGDEIV